MSHSSKTSYQYAAVCWLGVIAGILFLVWPLVSSEQTLAFRDAGHFYYRLFEFQQEQVQKHGLSVNVLWWNARENLGQSAHGDATASLYYPPKLWLWAGWPEEFTFRWNLYLIGHLCWALLGAGWLARTLKFQGVAAAWLALSYVASGVVLIQLCNVIYLVGASWLPWAVGFGLRAIQLPRWRWVIGGGVSLGMMVLGGDPQTAFHAVLILVLRIWLDRRFLPSRQDAPEFKRELASQKIAGSRYLGRNPEEIVRQWVGAFIRQRGYWGALMAMAVLGGWLSWIQISGSMGVINQSERNLWDLPRSLWEIPDFANRKDSLAPQQIAAASFEGMVQKPREGTHHDFAFQFSLPPWQVAEWLWPYVSGQLFPKNQRWTQQLPAADRVWYPSIYAGCLTCVLVTLVFFRRGGNDSNFRWARSALLFALLASMGWYGLGWVAKELWFVVGGRPDEVALGSQVGGLYWWMTVLLPGYIQFRYPAKLMIVAALMFSCLAGYAWKCIESGNSLRPDRWFAIFAGFTVLVLVGSWVAYPEWRQWVETAPPDAVFGPLLIDAAWVDVQSSLWQVIVMLMMGWAILRWSRRGGKERYAFGGTVLLLLCVVDLAMAHRFLLPVAPIDAWENPSTIAEVLAKTDTDRLTPIYRGEMEGWIPQAWWQQTTSSRLSEIVRWDTATLFPKHHLRYPLASVQVPAASVSSYHWILLQRSRQLGPKREDGQREPHLEWLSALGSRYLIVPSWSGAQWAEHADQLKALPARAGWPKDVLVLENEAALPACWTIQQVRYVPFSFGNDLMKAWEESKDVLLDRESGKPRDFAKEVLVHDARLVTDFTAPQEQEREQPNFIPGVILEDAPTRRVIQAMLNRAGWLVIPMSYDPGWTAVVRDLRDGKVVRPKLHRVNGLMTGLPLPSGKFEIELRYRPEWWGLHCFLWLLGWGIVGLGVLFMLYRGRP